MFKRIKNYLIYQIQKQLRPEIIGGYKRYDGVYLKNVGISNTTHISFKKNFHIEDRVWIAHFSYIDCRIKTTIREGSQIGFYVSIINHSSHLGIRLYGKNYSKNEELGIGMSLGEVVIGKHCFIGPHSIIMPNTEIGDGSIVSAYSMVKGKFPPYSILKGNPAIVIGDSRTLDEKVLNEHPELREYYYLNID